MKRVSKTNVSNEVLSNNETKFNNCTINNNFNISAGAILLVIIALCFLIFIALIISHLNPKTQSIIIHILHKIVSKD